MTFVKNTFIFSSQMSIILPFKLECVNKAEKLCLMLTSCSVFCSAFLFFFFVHRSEYHHGRKKPPGHGSVNLNVVKW